MAFYDKFRIFVGKTISNRMRELNITNGAKRMAEFLGHSKDLITLSPQVLIYNSLFIIKGRGHPRVNIRLFLLSGKGSQLVFCPPLNVKTNIETQ